MKTIDGSVSNAVLRAAAITLTAITGWSTAAAESAYTMTTIVDSAYGSDIVGGQYDKAIEALTAQADLTVSFEESTNLCVAYTKTRKLDAAALACDMAVSLAAEAGDDRRISISISRSALARHRARLLALALSNRGVLFAISGEREKATKDLEAALEIGSFKRVARVNLARLGDEQADNA